MVVRPWFWLICMTMDAVGKLFRQIFNGAATIYIRHRNTYISTANFTECPNIIPPYLSYIIHHSPSRNWYISIGLVVCSERVYPTTHWLTVRFMSLIVPLWSLVYIECSNPSLREQVFWWMDFCRGWAAVDRLVHAHWCSVRRNGTSCDMSSKLCILYMRCLLSSMLCLLRGLLVGEKCPSDHN